MSDHGQAHHTLPAAIDAQPPAQSGPSQGIPTPQVLIERRAWVRYACNLETACRPEGALRDAGWPARIVNLSAGGIALFLRHRFERGTPLFVELRGLKPSRHAVPLRVLHTRAAQLDGNTGWIIGCAFLDALSPQQVAVLLSQQQG